MSIEFTLIPFYISGCVQVWDACSDAAVTFGKADLSEDIAWIVENDLVQDSLMKELDKIEQVEVQYKTKVTNYRLPQNADELVQVTLEDGSCLTTDLIVSINQVITVCLFVL